MSAFADYAPFYDLMYQEKGYQDEAAFVISELSAADFAITNVLDLGCGTGLHALRLAEAGRRVHGIDVSPAMLELARRNLAKAPGRIAERVKFSLGDVRTVTLEETFDCVTSLFHVMSYQTDDRDVMETLATARRHLKKGSPFLFDFWHGPAVMASAPAVRKKIVQNDSYRVERLTTPKWEKALNRVSVHFHFVIHDKRDGSVREFHETHPMRYFFPENLERILNGGGFRAIKCAGWLTGRPLTEADFSAYFIAVAD